MTFISHEFSESERALAELIRKDSLNILSSTRLIDNISISSSSDTVVNHGLSREPIGYIIVKKSAICDIYHKSLSNLTMVIRGSTTATISILVF